ncbi:MAG: tRNA lysidine(34) synthetase TilS [Parvibaculaceae bacterium]
MTSSRPPRALTAPQFDKAIRPLFPSARLGLAVSGGADSVALMLLAARWRAWLEEKGKRAPSLTVLTVDHGLRTEAAREAKQVARWAKALGLPHKTLRWEGAKPAANLQAEARAARYRLLAAWCRTGRETADLVTAHHLDDQAETFLMRLQRGSGVDGLAAMAPISRRDGVRLLRPLLEVPRDRLRATLETAGQGWIEDPSNEDDRFLRVSVRKALPVLADLGLGSERLVATAKAMGRARAALEAATDALEREAVVWHPLGFATAARAVFREASDELALRLLRRLLRGVGGTVYGPRFQSLEPLLAALRAGKLGRGRTLGGVKLADAGDQVQVMREPSAVAGPLALTPGKTDIWDGRFEVGLTGRANGLTVRALGAEGLSQLRAHGVKLPPGVPKTVLQAVPSLWRGNRLLAQPSLGYQAARNAYLKVAFLPAG